MKNQNEGEVTMLEYGEAGSFFHCKHCIEQFLGSQLHEVMTPRDYGQYEVSNYKLNGETLIVVWCKRCRRPVWDSRSL